MKEESKSNIEHRDYCYQCKHWPVPIKNKPCNTCIGTRTVGGKLIDTYERRNYEIK